MGLPALSQFLSLALITYKYEFKALHTWAQGYINRFCVPFRSTIGLNTFMISVPTASMFPSSCSQNDLERLLHYAAVTGNTALHDEVEAAVLRRLDAKPRTLALSKALLITEVQWLS